MKENNQELYENSSQYSTNDKIEVKMLLLTMKVVRKPEFKEDLNCYKEVVKTVVKLVTKQAEDGNIAGVVEFNSNTKCKSFKEVNDWVYDPRILGKKNKKVQMFFKVQTTLREVELAKK